MLDKVSVRDTVRAIKKCNPHILIGQYSNPVEAYDDLNKYVADKDKYFKLYRVAWWLRNAAGRKIQWTSENDAWMINITEWAKTDSQGRRYPQWLAERDYRMYREPVPEFDIWYFENLNPFCEWDGSGQPH